MTYRVYWTDPELYELTYGTDAYSLQEALRLCEHFRSTNMIYVTMVSDYHDMVGKPGASGPDGNYVAQMLN